MTINCLDEIENELKADLDLLYPSLMYELKNCTLQQQIDNNTIELFNYLKHDGGKSKTSTGKALLMNQTNNLSVVDIDINKNLDDETKENIRNNIVNKLSNDDVIVKTGSSGLHI